MIYSYEGNHRGKADEQDEGHLYGKNGLAVPPSDPKQKDGRFCQNGFQC